MTIHLPDACLVVLVGPSGSGKSTFAKAHFLPTEILSSDFFRAMLADDESDQSVSAGAFELLHLAATKRLAYRRTTAIDATNVRTDARKHLLDIARKCGVPAIAPKTAILIRGDSHYGRKEAMDWCEQNGVAYIFGFSCDNEYWPTCADEYWPTLRCLIC